MSSPSNSRESIQSLLEICDARIRRVFYVSLTLAFVVIYLCLDSAGWKIAPVIPAASQSAAASKELAEIEPLIVAASLLRDQSGLIREYQDFLRPFITIESAASQAIVGVDNNAPAWLALDAGDRDRCQDLQGSPSYINFDLISADDPETVSLHYLVDTVGAELLIQTDIFANGGARAKIESCLYVARELGATVGPPESWPESFYFLDFLRARNDTAKLVTAIENLRAEWKGVRSTFAALDRICAANEMISCSTNELRSRIQRKALKIDTADEVEEPKLDISFLPTGIEASLILILAPVPLMITTFLLVSLVARRTKLLQALRALEEPEVSRLRETHSVASGIDLDVVSPGLLVNGVLALYIAVGEMTPLLAQISVIIWEFNAGVGYGWRMLAMLCALATVMALSGHGLRRARTLQTAKPVLQNLFRR